MRPTASLVAIALAVVVPVAVAATPQPVEPLGVTWGYVHFTDSKELSSWLSRRGVRYRDWARRHPAGQYLLTHPAAPARVAAPAATTHGLKAILVAFLSLAALLFGMSAAGGQLVRLTQAPIEPARVTTARLGAAGGAVAVVIGAALAWWL